MGEENQLTGELGASHVSEETNNNGQKAPGKYSSWKITDGFQFFFGNKITASLSPQVPCRASVPHPRVRALLPPAHRGQVVPGHLLGQGGERGGAAAQRCYFLVSTPAKGTLRPHGGRGRADTAAGRGLAPCGVGCRFRQAAVTAILSPGTWRIPRSALPAARVQSRCHLYGAELSRLSRACWGSSFGPPPTSAGGGCAPGGPCTATGKAAAGATPPAQARTSRTQGRVQEADTRRRTLTCDHRHACPAQRADLGPRGSARGVTAHGTHRALGGDGKVLEPDSGDGCTRLQADQNHGVAAPPTGPESSPPHVCLSPSPAPV